MSNLEETKEKLQKKDSTEVSIVPVFGDNYNKLL